MSCIVYRTNPNNNVTYAYRSESYRDPETKRPKSRRTYLGRVDPETNLIVPKGEDGKRNRSKLGKQPAIESMPKDTAKLISELRQEVEQLKRENSIIQAQLKKQEDKGNTLIQQLRNAINVYAQQK